MTHMALLGQRLEYLSMWALMMQWCLKLGWQQQMTAGTCFSSMRALILSQHSYSVNLSLRNSSFFPFHSTLADRYPKQLAVKTTKAYFNLLAEVGGKPQPAMNLSIWRQEQLNSIQHCQVLVVEDADLYTKTFKSLVRLFLFGQFDSPETATLWLLRLSHSIEELLVGAVDILPDGPISNNDSAPLSVKPVRYRRTVML